MKDTKVKSICPELIVFITNIYQIDLKCDKKNICCIPAPLQYEFQPVGVFFHFMARNLKKKMKIN